MDDYFAGSVTRPQPQQPQPLPQPPLPQPPFPPQQEPPPYARVGWAPPSASAGFPSYPGAPFPYQPAGRPTSHKVLLGFAIGMVLLVVVGILAAIAVPAFLDQRAKAEEARTTVEVPEQVLGMPHLTDPVSAQGERGMESLPGPGDHLAGVFGTGSIRVLVGAAHYHLTAKDQREFLDAARSEATDRSMTLTKVAAGKLGGTMSCGAAVVSVQMTLCVFVDGGSYGIVLVTGPVDDPTGTARAAREAFVHRD